MVALMAFLLFFNFAAKDRGRPKIIAKNSFCNCKNRATSPQINRDSMRLVAVVRSVFPASMHSARERTLWPISNRKSHNRVINCPISLAMCSGSGFYLKLKYQCQKVDVVHGARNPQRRLVTYQAAYQIERIAIIE